MSHELIYTSVPRGLRPGTSGFCTVAMTARLPDAMVERLESLSAYRAIFPLGDPQAGRNPVIWAHWRVTVSERPRSVLSRVAFAGSDYSQRSNKFAHHIVLEPNEQSPAGPAWVLGQPGVMESDWAGEPRLIPTGRAMPSGNRPAAPCMAWQAATGDAGWAGVLADSFIANPSKPAYLIYQPGTDLLPLIEEAIALLPPAMRWQVTFSTYFTDLPMGATCIWRCVVAGTNAAKEAARSGTKPLQIDLTKPMGPAPDSALVAAARTGRVPTDAASIPRQPGPPPGELTLRFKEDQTPDDERPQDRAANLGAAPTARRRLRPDDISVDAIEETDEENPWQEATDQPAAPVQPSRIQRRGIPIWLALTLCIACLGCGIAIGYGIHVQRPIANSEQKPAPAIVAEASGGRPDLNEGTVLRPAKELNAPDRPQPAAVSTSQPVTASPDGAPPPVIPGPPPAPTPAATQAGTASWAASETVPGTRPVSSREAIVDLPPIPDANGLAELIPDLKSVILPPPRKPKGGTGEMVASTWPVPDVDRICLLFPDGKRVLNTNLTTAPLKISAESRGASVEFLAIQGSSTQVIAELEINAGNLNLTWVTKDLSLAGSVRAAFEKSTVLASDNGKTWTKLIAFQKSNLITGADSKPQSLAKSVIFKPPQDLAQNLFLFAKDRGNSGWKARRTAPQTIELTKEHGKTPLLAVLITYTQDRNSDGFSTIKVSSNWAQGRQEDYIMSRHPACLLRYGQLRNPISKNPPDRAVVVENGKEVRQKLADVRQSKAHLQAEKAEGDKAKELAERIKTLNLQISQLQLFADRYEELMDLERQIDDFIDIGPIDGEFRLPNGLSVGHFTFTVPPELKAPWR